MKVMTTCVIIDEPACYRRFWNGWVILGANSAKRIYLVEYSTGLIGLTAGTPLLPQIDVLLFQDNCD
jgi:hypothetical protein